MFVDPRNRTDRDEIEVKLRTQLYAAARPACEQQGKALPYVPIQESLIDAYQE